MGEGQAPCPMGLSCLQPGAWGTASYFQASGTPALNPSQALVPASMAGS